MDRRRFVPSAVGLEGRALMSLFGSSSQTALTTSLQNLPENYREKLKRIENLPYFLNSFQPGRYMDPQAMEGIQASLVQIAGRLHGLPEIYVNGFNSNLRHAFPYNTLSPDTAKILNHSYSVVLVQAGTDPTVLQNLTNDMNTFALVDSKSVNPSYLARNDYGLVEQISLAVGRPIPAPSAPTISPKVGKATDGGKAGYTFDPNPLMVGTYDSGSSTDGATSIDIINNFDQVLATAVVRSDGHYSVVLPTLSPGIYKLSSRATDIYGLVSKQSRAFTLKVAAPT